MADHEGVSPAQVASSNAGKGKHSSRVLDVQRTGGGLRGAVAHCYCDTFYMCVCMYAMISR